MLLTITIDKRRNLQKEELHMAAAHQRLMDAWRGPVMAIQEIFSQDEEISGARKRPLNEEES